MNKFCTACGHPLPAGCLFCVECGASQAAPQIEPASAPPASPAPVPPAPPPAPRAEAARPAPAPTPQPSPPVAPAASPQPIRSVPPAAPPVAAAGHFSWTRALAAMLACSALLGALYRGWARLGSSLPSATPPAWTATPAASPTSAVAEPQADLTLAEGEWTLDPRDPKYSESDRGTFYLHREGPELRGKGPEDSSFRLWAEGAGLVGEASESGGKTWKMKWEWTVPGRSVRLLLSDSQGANQEAVLIRPSDLPAASPTTTPDVTPAPIPVLYEVRGDLNGDGKPETVQVLGCDGQDRPDTDGHKQMRILSVDSETLFESETFQEPFHVDSDVYAQKTEERAGVHILSKGSGYPLIRLVFASASGNFVDFKFNGSRFVLAEIGD